MIDLQNLTLYFNRGTPVEKIALKNVSLKIQEQEFITVIGTNGAGKSTLLNALSGEAPIDEGKLFLDGVDVTTMNVHKRAKWIGRVFQDPLIGTCGLLTVEENLALALMRSQSSSFFDFCTPAIDPSHLDQFIELLASLNLGLEKRLKSPIGLLSGGQRQAISLLMTTLSPMKLLLLDEHTAALDPKTAEAIIKITTQIIRSKKLTTLMVTHSLTEALECGSRLIMLKEGEIILDVKDEEKKSLTIQHLLSRYTSN